MLTYILLIAGFILLIKGADFLVEGASSVAKKIGISSLVIGLTVVAFGTSAPELIVNIFASFKNNTDIAIGNVLGSNIANILLILGVSALIFPLKVKRSTVWKEIPFSLLAVIVAAIMANDILLDKDSFSGLTRSDGLVFICFFIIFLYYTFSISKEDSSESNKIEIKKTSFFTSLLKIIFGLAGLTLGGKWIVDSAVDIAASFGVSQAIIGLTVVAVGTSLPELATSAVAAFKKNTDIAVGNIVGSNIFNILWILGVSSLINPLPFSNMMMFDVCVDVAATLALFMFMFVGIRHTLQRWQGGIFVITYILYIILLVLREIKF